MAATESATRTINSRKNDKIEILLGSSKPFLLSVSIWSWLPQIIPWSRAVQIQEIRWNRDSGVLCLTHLPIHLLTVTRPVLLTSNPDTAAGVILPILKECKVLGNASLVHKSISFQVLTFLPEGALSSSFAPVLILSSPCSPSHCQTNVCAGFQHCSFQSLSLNQRSLLA